MQDHSRLIMCKICQREIPRPFLVTSDLVFCPEHKREFKRRQHEGVSTTELDPLWGDTLENWRERPPELEKETKPRFLTGRFILWKNDHSWIIFERAYIQIKLPRRNTSIIRMLNPQKDPWRIFRGYKPFPPRHRFSDYIVMKKQTGEIRYYIDVTLTDILNDLRGICPAPAQEELTEFWGKRKPNGIREKTREQVSHQFQDKGRRIHIPDLVHFCHFPFYGPVGNPLDLTLSCNTSFYVSSLNSLFSVSFTYVRSSQANVTLELVVSEVKTSPRTFFDNHAFDPVPSSFDMACEFFQNQSNTALKLDEGLSSWKGEMTIAGVAFLGEWYHLSLPDHFSWFSLKSEQTWLMGNARGLSENELVQWIKALQIINQRNDLLLSYQHEYNEDWQQRRSCSIDT